MFTLSRAERQDMIDALRDELRDRFDVEPGELAVEMLLDTIIEQLGPPIYNKALNDATAVVQRRAEEIAESILNLEKRVPRRR
jgi:uncharacterized protein (DUF2164 family)